MLLIHPTQSPHPYRWLIVYPLSILLAILSMACQGTEKTITAPKPNIIYIMADDLGYADIGPFGQTLIQTPYLDQMAREGMKFTQHYAGTAVCAPSRCVLMTGLHTGHAEIRGNKQYPPGNNGQQPISAATKTIAEYMKELGYHTGLIGKWGLGNTGTSGDPNQQGFDYAFGYLDQVLAHNYFPDHLIRNGEKIPLSNEVTYLDTSYWHKGLGSYATRKKEYSHDLFVEDALQYIETHRNEPFFLYLPITIPHDNGEAPKGDRMEVPSQGIYTHKDWGKDEKDYAAMITRMDEGIGRILSQLEELGLTEETLLIFTSDNGPMPGESFTDFFDSNGSLRGGKRDLYEGGIRVPMIARWKGTVQAGASSAHISAFWDVLPTLIEVAGGEIPSGIDGLSFLPTLKGQNKQATHPYLYWEFHEKTGAQAIRQNHWKAIRNDAITQAGNELELYDLRTDIGETQNVAKQFPEKVAEIEALIEQAHSHSPLFPKIKAGQ